MRLPDLRGIHDKIAKDAGLPNIVYCRLCGRSESVDPGYCLKHGWPRCCNYTMTIDKPKEEKE